MNGEPLKFCPVCGSEYRLAASECADCKVPLSLEGEPRSARGPRFRALPRLPPYTEAACIRVAPLAFCQELAHRLADEGIPCRIDMESGGGSGTLGDFGRSWMFGVYVRPEDKEPAFEIDLVCMQAPGTAPRERACGHSSGKCPICGTPLGEGESHCPQCSVEPDRR